MKRLRSIATCRTLARGLLSLCAVGAAWFVFSLWSALQSHSSNSLSCNAGPGAVNGTLTYLQFDVLDQQPVEPYFNGRVFVSLGNAYGKNPVHTEVMVSGNGAYAGTAASANLTYDENNKTLWMSKPVDTGLNRVSGTHRNFPFDSARIVFDVTYDSKLPIHNFIIRNQNSSFDLKCSAYVVRRTSANTVHIAFELRRNPLVTLTAVILIVAGVLFLIAIVVFIKIESMPTSVASFFFSLWSIRTILSSEIKTFPTTLDLAILSLCVALLVALGVRLAIKEIPALDKPDGHDEGY